MQDSTFLTFIIYVLSRIVKHSDLTVLLERAFEPFPEDVYKRQVIDRLARAFYPAILACWNSEEGQREFAAWQAEQAHHAPSKEKQSVPDGERPVVHIAIVCGLWQGASGRAHPVFVLPLIF